ncbi:HPF/RaiA family ribosome-associated protein [uncultured Limnohabitans sp.]|jgi:ribosome-associated translation inhibitor RaiA|uniref:HPF/RaiA family ribosome-associated protein n=1 Tax=uncultured Limnohabitans sp. TaxID=768543 RepID=UPI0026171DBC|nr:HPF/RaiA family ribosome-associated protein [uncultured Limnohabitans sp.]
MKIQINTDVNIQSNEALTTLVQDAIDHALSRFAEHITRIEVHLSDENAAKNGQRDQRCMIEARLEGRQPVAVTEQAPAMAQAVQGAAQKLAHLLSSALGRLHDHKEKTSGLPLSGTEQRTFE